MGLVVDLLRMYLIIILINIRHAVIYLQHAHNFVIFDCIHLWFHLGKHGNVFYYYFDHMIHYHYNVLQETFKNRHRKFIRIFIPSSTEVLIDIV